MSELTAYKCEKCGHVMFPAHLRCLKCKGRDFTAVPVAGECTLLTFSEVRNLPWGIDERSRVLGVVEFAKGFKAMGWIQSPEASVGMKLKAAQEPVRTIGGEQVYGLVFKPLD
jgi:uncharacterized OB-fold protein